MASLSSAISYGALEWMLQGTGIQNPTLQVLDFKPIRDGRLRVQLWDAAERYDYCMISKRAAQRIGGGLERNCLIRVKSFDRVDVDDRIVIVVTELEVSAPTNDIFSDSYRSRNLPARRRGASEDAGSISTPTPRRRSRRMTQSNITQIATLEPNHVRCTIRARVSSKREIYFWQKKTAGGRLFSFEVYDRSGKISVTAFNSQCDQLFPLIERGKVYYISGFKCGSADGRWRTNDHPCALILGKQSSVEPCTDLCDDIPEFAFNFIPISGIEAAPANQKFDMCAVLKSVGTPQILNRRSDGRPIVKRDVYIVDDSMKMVKLTMWHDAGHKLNRSDNPVLLIPQVEKQTFDGQLSVSTRNCIEINPDLDVARTLASWWTNVGKGGSFEIVSGAGESPDSDREYVDFGIMRGIAENYPKFSKKALYLWNRATITYFNRDYSAYKACSNGNCSKKVQEQSDGMYFCAKCASSTRNYEWRFLLNMTLSDATGELRCRAFNREAERILGVTSGTFGEYIENDVYEMDRVFSAAMFKTLHFKFRGEKSTFRGKDRYEFTVVEVAEIEPSGDCRHFLNDIGLLEEFL